MIAAASIAPDVRERARRAAFSIGERLLEEVGKPDTYDVNGERCASRRMNGTVGYALTFLVLARASGDQRYERAMHAQLKRAAQADCDGAPGLFDGIAGLRAVCSLATAIEPHYETFVRRCDDLLDRLISEQPLDVESFERYDLISGWAGIRIGRSIRDRAPADPAMERLIWFLSDQSRWLCKARFSQTLKLERNLGLAHGLPGVLASLALTAPSIDERLCERMSRAAGLITDSVRRIHGYYDWPRIVEDPDGVKCRSVWCYGAAGVAIALLAVAQRLRDAQLERFATDVLLELCERPSESLLMGEQTICHGTSGIAMILFAAAQCTGDERFTRGCERFVRETLDGFEAAGNRCVTRGRDQEFYDALGAFLGVAGIALTLLTATGDADPGWLRIFALPKERC